MYMFQTLSCAHEQYVEGREKLPDSIRKSLPLEGEMSPQDFIKEELKRYKNDLSQVNNKKLVGKQKLDIKLEAMAKEKEKTKEIKVCT